MDFDLSEDQADAARRSIRGWMQGQTHYVAGRADELEHSDVEETWADEDAFATECELLANAARVAATIGQRLDLARRKRLAQCSRQPAAAGAADTDPGPTL